MHTKTDKKTPFINRDLSWLSFNYRVLQEAKDPSVPLFERIKFLAIYSNNLDEFFRVRIASIRNLLRLGKKTKKVLDIQVDRKEVLNQLLDVVNEQQVEFTRIFEKEIKPLLKKNKIYLKTEDNLNKEQSEFVETYFNEYMLPFVQPVLLNRKKIRPFLNNGQLYLNVLLQDKEKPEGGKKMAIVKIPSDHLNRFIELPSPNRQYHLIMLDDIVRKNLPRMFPGYNILGSYSIKLTRDAELYIDDEFSGDLLSKIKDSLLKRKIGNPSRFIYDRNMPLDMLHNIVDIFDIHSNDMIEEGRYHNNSDFFQFPSFGMDHLKYKKLPSLPYHRLENNPNFFKAIEKEDHLLHFPYDSYESVIQLFERAASDPHVTHIKVIQYRVAKKSRIMSALKKAVRKGKHVFVFIEVKARFDEEANLQWGQELVKAGVNVQYSFPGVKVHSKLALIRRVNHNKESRYVYLSTGNFHEDTAKLYTDFGLFTHDSKITEEVARLFNFLETVKVPQQKFEHLLVGQFNLRSKLNAMVDREIQNARQGKRAKIILKMNSLQDEKMIRKLYEASRQGVKIRLIIRGICSLVPGDERYSKNIKAISIVDRFLEHSRVFVFHNDGKKEVYLSSADWMVRNLNYRIETAFPVYDPKLKKEIIDILNMQLSDNVKARILDADMENKYQEDDSNIIFNSQLESYFYAKRKK